MKRKSKRTGEGIKAVLAAMEKGRSLRSICAELDFAASTFLLWVSKDDDLAEQYAHARNERADYIFDEMLDIADNATNDWMKRELNNGTIIEVPDKEAVQRSKLRLETRKWMLGKMKPKKYGDILRHKHGGDEDSAPIEHEIKPSTKLADMVNSIVKRSAKTGEPE